MSLETKFITPGMVTITDGTIIEGYASLFDRPDRGGDIVERGAFSKSLKALKSQARTVKMLWQHDPSQPIGLWEEIAEDARGLKVRGRILTNVVKGREAAALVAAGAIDGLSIGYRTRRSSKDKQGRRVLKELELWEVSIVTFPMLPDARLGRKRDPLRDLASAITAARKQLTGG